MLQPTQPAEVLLRAEGYTAEWRIDSFSQHADGGFAMGLYVKVFDPSLLPESLPFSDIKSLWESQGKVLRLTLEVVAQPASSAHSARTSSARR